LVRLTNGLHIIEETMNQMKYVEVLGRLLRQVAEWFPAGNDFIFQQDGAPCLTGRSWWNDSGTTKL